MHLLRNNNQFVAADTFFKSTGIEQICIFEYKNRKYKAFGENVHIRIKADSYLFVYELIFLIHLKAGQRINKMNRKGIKNWH